MGFIRYLFRQHRALSALLVMAVCGLLYFGGSFVSEVLYFSDPAHRDQKLAMWMSPRYVAKSWDLPREIIIDVMQLEPDHKQKTLADVTEHLGIGLEELESRIRIAKTELREQHHRGKFHD